MDPDPRSRPPAPGSQSRPPGTLGALEIGEQIGRGGMGQVYRAHDPHLNRDVALKMLHSGSLARFQREAQLIATLNHPGIVKVYRYWQEAETACLTMDLVEGVDLGRLLEQTPQLPPKRAAELGAKVARAVAHAHAKGVIHRDLKPANILIDAAGDPRVVDFGLALALSEERLTLSEEVMGTPAYMAPEQIQGKSVDARCDIYAIGLVLFRCLAGALPFRVSSREALFAQILIATPSWPAEIHVPPDFSAIVLKAIAKHPDDRYATAQDLALDLERFLSGAPVSARPPGLLRRSARMVRANPAIFCLIALLLSGSSGWLMFALHGQRQRSELMQQYRQQRDRARLEQRRTRLLLERERTLRAKLERSRRTSQARALIQRAQTLVRERGDRTQVLQLLGKADTLAPGQATALRLRGQLALQDQDWPRAERLLRKALTSDETDYLTHFHLYRWYQLQGRGSDNAAEAHVTAAARYGTDTPIGWWGRANRSFLLAQKRTDASRQSLLRQAVASCEKALDQQPEFAWAILLRANCRSRLGLDEQAERGFDHAIRLTDWPTAYLNRGLHHHDRGRYAKAIADMDRAIKRRPTFVAAYYGRGMAQVRLERYERAMEDFGQVISLDPGHARAHLNRGNIHLLRSRHTQALEDYGRALRLDPELTEGRIMRAKLYLEVGRQREAMAQLDQALARQPNEPNLYYHRALTWLQLNRFRNALQDLDAALRMRPRWPDALYHRGLAARVSGQPERAVRDFEALLRQDPTHLDGLLNHGLACYQLKRYRDAVDSWEKSVTRIQDPALRSSFMRKLTQARARIEDR